MYNVYISSDGKFEKLPRIKEQIVYLEETMQDTEIELEYSKNQDMKVGYKTANTSFLSYKTHIAMTPETIVESEEKHNKH